MENQGINRNEQKIYYEKNAKFRIVPPLNDNDKSKFIQFLSETKNMYTIFNQNSIGDPNGNFPNFQDSHFFWDFDETKGNIIINEKTEIVENDIFNQLTILLIWLFQKNYYLKGHFHCRIDNIIEYISLNGINKFVTHHILVDDKIDNQVNDFDIDGGKIILDAKIKINEFINNGNEKDDLVILDKKKIKPSKKIEMGSKYFYNKNITCQQEGSNKNISYIVINTDNKYDEERNVTNIFQERLTHVENELHALTRVNKFFWKICTVISVFTAGSFLMYMIMEKDSNITLNNCLLFIHKN